MLKIICLIKSEKVEKSQFDKKLKVNKNRLKAIKKNICRKIDILRENMKKWSKLKT